MAKEATVRESAAFPDIERDDLMLRSGFEPRNLAQRQRRIRHIERAGIGGEGKAIGLFEISHAPKVTALRIKTVDAAMI